MIIHNKYAGKLCKLTEYGMLANDWRFHNMSVGNRVVIEALYHRVKHEGSVLIGAMPPPFEVNGLLLYPFVELSPTENDCDMFWLTLDQIEFINNEL